MFALLSLIIAASAASRPSGPSGPEWLETSWQFGRVAETEGKVCGRVRLVNTTPAPIIVDRVHTTCGCTAVAWPETPVLPGDTATISFTFDPLGRPGRIDKRLKVYLDGSNDPREIRLQGVVIPSEETLACSYPVDCGDLRLGTDMIEAGTIRPGVARHLFIYLYNRGLTPLIPVWDTSDPRLRITLTPDTIPPGESATLVLRLTAPPGAGEGETVSSLTLWVEDTAGVPVIHPSLPHRITIRGDILPPGAS